MQETREESLEDLTEDFRGLISKGGYITLLTIHCIKVVICLHLDINTSTMGKCSLSVCPGKNEIA